MSCSVIFPVVFVARNAKTWGIPVEIYFFENRNYVVGFRQSPCILSSFTQKNGFAPQRHHSPGCSKFIPPKYESLFHKSRKEIELPFSMKYSKLAVRISSIISKNKIQAKGFRMIQAAWKSIEAIRRYLQKC